MTFQLPWFGLIVLGAGLHLLLAHFQTGPASFVLLYGSLALFVVARAVRYVTYYLLTPGSNYFFKRSRECELYLNTLNSFVFALEIVQKELLGWAQTGLAKADQAVLPKIRHDLDAFAIVLTDAKSRKPRAAALARRVQEIVRAFEAIRASAADGQERSGWDLLSEFRHEFAERSLTSLQNTS